MDLWSPPHDAPHLLEWWRPLMLVSRRARLERFPWPVHLDEFRLAGRVRRQGRPDIWIYDHHENRGSVCVDGTGQTYRFFATPRAKGVGQFRPCELRSALWRARLPDVVEPVSYAPVGAGDRERADAVPEDAVLDDADATGLGVMDAAHHLGDTADDLDDFDDQDDRDEIDDLDDDRVDTIDAAGRRVVRRGHLTLIAG